MGKFWLNKDRILIALVIVFAISLFYVWFFQPKIAYVRTGYVIEKFKDTKTADSVFHVKKIQWQKSIDSLKTIYTDYSDAFLIQKKSLSEKEIDEKTITIRKMERYINNYIDNISENEKIEYDKLMNSIYVKVNTAISEFAKKNNYSIVLGTTSEGSIMYAHDGYDITEKIIYELNK